MKKRFIITNAVMLAVMLAIIVYVMIIQSSIFVVTQLYVIGAFLPVFAVINAAMGLAACKSVINKKALLVTNGIVLAIVLAMVLYGEIYYSKHLYTVNLPAGIAQSFIFVYCYLLVFAVANAVLIMISARKNKAKKITE